MPGYLTAIPQGKLSVWTGVCGVNPPLEGVMAYCERFAWVRLVTNNQLSSLRMAIEVGYEFVAIVAGLSGERLPVVVLIRYADISF